MEKDERGFPCRVCGGGCWSEKLQRTTLLVHNVHCKFDIALEEEREWLADRSQLLKKIRVNRWLTELAKQEGVEYSQLLQELAILRGVN